MVYMFIVHGRSQRRKSQHLLLAKINFASDFIVIQREGNGSETWTFTTEVKSNNTNSFENDVLLRGHIVHMFKTQICCFQKEN